MQAQNVVNLTDTSSSSHPPHTRLLPNAQLKDVPQALITFILEDLKFLEIFLFSLISKKFYAQSIIIMDQFAQKFLLKEFPYLASILREVKAEEQKREIKMNVNCFTACNNRLMTAFDIYAERIRKLPDYYSSSNKEELKMVNSFHRLLEMGDVGAAISILIRHGKNHLLLSSPTPTGKTIPRELVSYLPNISLSEIQPGGKKSPLSESQEITYNNQKRLLDYLFELMIQSEFATIWRKKPRDLYGIPTSEEISKQILADAEKILTPDILKAMAETYNANANWKIPMWTEKFKSQEKILRQVFQLFVFSYTCYQLNIVDVIRKKYLMPDSIILSEQLMTEPLVNNCFCLGQVKLIAYLLAKIGKKGITEYNIQKTIELGDVRLMGLLKATGIEINKYQYRDGPAFEAILSKRNPVFTLASLRNVHISSISSELKKKIILQLNIIGETPNFLDAWKRENNSNFNDPQFDSLKKLASQTLPPPSLTRSLTR